MIRFDMSLPVTFRCAGRWLELSIGSPLAVFIAQEAVALVTTTNVESVNRKCVFDNYTSTSEDLVQL